MVLLLVSLIGVSKQFRGFFVVTYYRLLSFVKTFHTSVVPPIRYSKGAFTRKSKNGTDPTKTGTVPIVFPKKQ